MWFGRETRRRVRLCAQSLRFENDLCSSGVQRDRNLRIQGKLAALDGHGWLLSECCPAHRMATVRVADASRNVDTQRGCVCRSCMGDLPELGRGGLQETQRVCLRIDRPTNASHEHREITKTNDVRSGRSVSKTNAETRV